MGFFYLANIVQLAYGMHRRHLTKVLAASADIEIMEISGISSSYRQLAGSASAAQSDNLTMELSTRIMKKVMDSQQQQSEALVKMINSNTQSLEGAGKLINLQV